MFLSPIFGGGASPRPESKPAPAEPQPGPKNEPASASSSSPKPSEAPPSSQSQPAPRPAGEPSREQAAAAPAARGDDARRGEAAEALVALAPRPSEDAGLAEARALAEAAVVATRQEIVLERTAAPAAAPASLAALKGSVDGNAGPALAADVETVRAMDAPRAEAAVDRKV